MEDTIISVRIDKELYRKMKTLDYINWSSILRKSIANQISKLSEDNFDIEKAKEAARNMDLLRKKGAFSKGKESTLIIREWRDKRK